MALAKNLLIAVVVLSWSNAWQPAQAQTPRKQAAQAPKEQARESTQRSQASLSLPGSEVIRIQASLPDEVHVADSFEYQIHVANVSDDVLLSQVKISQQLSPGVRIESAKIVSSQPRQAPQQKPSSGQPPAQADGEQRSNQGKQKDQGKQSDQGKQQAEWTIDRIGPGETKTIVVTAAGDQEGAADFCLTVSSFTPSLCISTTFVKPELEIVKQAPERASLCDEIEFAYFVKNTGTGNIDQFEIHDSLADGLHTVSGEKQLRFQVDGGLRPGETRKFVARLRAEKPGEFASRAVAVLADGKQTRSTRPATLVQAAQLSVALDGPNSQYIGRLMNYTIRVTNNGDIASPDTQLTLYYPSAVRLARIRAPHKSQESVSSPADAGQSAPTPATDSSRQDRQPAAQQASSQQQMVAESLELGRLDPGQTWAVDFAVVADRAGTVGYRAVVGYVCAEGEGKEREVTAQALTRTDLIALPALAIGVTDDKDPVAVGDELVYTIGVQNEGEASDQDIRVTAELAEGLKLVEASGVTEGQHKGQTITFKPVPELAAGDHVQWKVRTQVTKASEAQLTAKVTSKNRQREATAEEPTRLFDAQNSAKQKPSGSSQDSADKKSQQ